MEKISTPASTSTARAYYELTKPGIIMGNLITMAGGFALASRGHLYVWLLLATFTGLSLVIASACVFNNYIDRDTDKKMARTQHRTLAAGRIPEQNALLFASILVLLGTLTLALFTNFLTAAIALFGFFVYVILYSFCKYRTVHGTLIGSIAGAVPPVVGYCAVSGRFEVAALLLFLMIALWQMPHFFSIAIYRLEDYAAASIPVLPIKKGMKRTKVQMLLYIIAFIIVSCMLTAQGYTGYAYLSVASLLGLGWLWLSIKGFRCANDKQWARKMFFFSLLIVTALSAMIPFSVL